MRDCLRCTRELQKPRWESDNSFEGLVEWRDVEEAVRWEARSGLEGEVLARFLLIWLPEEKKKSLPSSKDVRGRGRDLNCRTESWGNCTWHGQLVNIALAP